MKNSKTDISTLRNKNEDFFLKVYEIVMNIPFGKVTTYGHIAKALGARSSSRLVGYALNNIGLIERKSVPCHRVVNRNGDLSGKMHFETPTAMREALEEEGIEITNDRVNLKQHLWEPFIRDF